MKMNNKLTLIERVACCSRCNRAKGTMEYDDFVDLVHQIHHNLNYEQDS